MLFEDPHLLAVNKPSGLPTLPGGGFMENTLLRLVQKQTPNCRLQPCPPVGPSHHRHRPLRQNTAGGASNLFANWNTPKIRKIYRALAPKYRTARRLRNPHTHRPRTAPAHRFRGWQAANPSRQTVKVIGKVGGLHAPTSTTIFRSKPKFRSRPSSEIRIHLASIGHPLVGDPLYMRLNRPSLLKISPASPAMEDISCTPNI